MRDAETFVAEVAQGTDDEDRAAEDVLLTRARDHEITEELTRIRALWTDEHADKQSALAQQMLDELISQLGGAK